MNEIELKIYHQLQQRPDEVCITPDGKELYALTEGGMIRFTGPNFNEMTDEEINDFIVNDELKEANNS